MKRNKLNQKQTKSKARSQGASKYAAKVACGKQVYGNGAEFHGGCCAHGVKTAAEREQTK